jgi:putative ABC transport system permease protein
MWSRTAIRTRWPSTLVLVALTGLAFGAALAALTGARRTDTAVGRLLDATNATDAVFVGDESYFSSIERLPQVASAVEWVFLAVAVSQPASAGASGVDVATVAVLSEPGTPHGMPWALVVDGRLADATRADEVVVNASAARHLGLHVGSHVRFDSFGPDQTDAFLQSRAVAPTGPTVDATVVGIVRSAADLSPVSPPPDAGYVSNDMLAFTKAFFDEHRDDIGHFQVVQFVRLHGGLSSFASWASSVGKVTGDARQAAPGSDEQLIATHVQRSTHLEAVALLGFAVVLAAGTLLVIGQAVSREVSRDARDNQTLVALGFTSNQLRLALLGRPVVVAVAGGVLAVPVAVALSPLSPIGLARNAEPNPGIDVNAAIVAGGAVVLVVMLVAGAWLAVRRFTAPVDTGAAPRRARRGWLAGTRSPSALVGVGFAYGNRNGRGGAPIMIGLVFGAAAIIASAVFSASLHAFAASPRQQGWSWDVEVGNPHTRVDTRGDAVPLLAADPAVERFVGITGEQGGPALVNGTFTNIVGFDVALGDVTPPVLDGRAPTAPDEVAMGVRTLAAAHTRIGEEVTIAGGQSGVAATYHVVGAMVVSPLITNGQVRLGEGVAATLDGLERISPGSPVNQYLIELRPGVDRDSALATLRARFPNAVVPYFRAADVENLWRIRTLPYLLGLLLLVLSLGTLLHALISSVRDRRRDLATLTAIGFTRRQRRSIVRWQTAALVVPAVAIALPIGVIGGRVAWHRLARQLGVSAPAVTPVLLMTLGMIGLFLAVTAIAILPSHRAATTYSAIDLRSDTRA